MILAVLFNLFVLLKCDPDMDIAMPGISPNYPDAYVCTSKKIIPPKLYLTSFKVHSSMEVAHHIILYGCKIPYYSDDINLTHWSCGNICADQSQKIIFAWARNASQFDYPKDVGYKVGSNFDVSYLVLQVHYLNPVKKKDYSHITIKTSQNPPKYEAGMFLMLAFQQYIPPHLSVVHVDIACPYRGPTIYPFSFRTHAHALGRAISAYVIKQNVTHVSWSKIGIGSPQWPQAFYPTTRDLVIEPGDILAARCTFDSRTSSTTVAMGPTHLNEMCNFYIMYYVASQPAATSTKPDENPVHQGHSDIFGADKRIFGADKRIFGADKRIFGADKRPSHFVASDYCEDLQLPNNPFNSIPFDTDPEELMNINQLPANTSPGAPGGGGGGGMGSHNLMLPVNDSFFVDLSLSGNTRIIDQSFTSKTMSPPPKFFNSPGYSPSTFNKDWNSRDFVFDHNFPANQTSQLLGPVSGMDIHQHYNQRIRDRNVTLNYLYVFHRGSRVWDENSFDLSEKFKEPENPINVSTILVLDLQRNGTIVASTGANIFLMPHGITVDSEGNLWLTDVGLHQVFKVAPIISPEQLNTAKATAPSPQEIKLKFLLVLGRRAEPGSDSTHFCKPTSVSVLPSGQFFVADGYCNSRIIQFSKDGTYLREFGQPSTITGILNINTLMKIPHSLALAKINNPAIPGIDFNLLFIADRENGRIICLKLDSLSQEGDSKRQSEIECPALIVSSDKTKTANQLVSSVQRGSIYALTYVPLNPGNSKQLDDKDTVGYLVVLRGHPLNPMVSYPAALLIYPLRLNDMFPERGRILVSVAPLKIFPLTQKYGSGNIDQPHDITAQLSPDNQGLTVYLANLNADYKKIWKFQLTPLVSQQEAGNFVSLTSKRPSVKKAGVSMFVSYPQTSDKLGGKDNSEQTAVGDQDSPDDGFDEPISISANGVLPALNPTDLKGFSETGKSSNETAATKLAKTYNARTSSSWLSTIANSGRKFNASTFIIILALGIPITLTCIILLVMRKQSKYGKITKFSRLKNNYGGPGEEDGEDDEDENNFDTVKFLRSGRYSNARAANGISNNSYYYNNYEQNQSATKAGTTATWNFLSPKFWKNRIYSPLNTIYATNAHSVGSLTPKSNVPFRPLRNSNSGKLHYYYDSEGSSLSPDESSDKPNHLTTSTTKTTNKGGHNYGTDKKDDDDDAASKTSQPIPGPLSGKGHVANKTAFGQFNFYQPPSNSTSETLPNNTQLNNLLLNGIVDSGGEEDDVLDLKDYYNGYMTPKTGGNSKSLSKSKSAQDTAASKSKSPSTSSVKKGKNMHQKKEFKFGDLANVHNSIQSKNKDIPSNQPLPNGTMNGHARDLVNGTDLDSHILENTIPSNQSKKGGRATLTTLTTTPVSSLAAEITSKTVNQQ